METNVIHGFTVKEKNKARIAVGIHRDGLSSLLAKFGITDDLADQVVDQAQPWVNISLVRRDQEHPKGYTHFVVGDLKRGGQDG